MLLQQQWPPPHTLPENMVRKQEDRVGRNVSNNTESVTDQRCQVYNGHVPSYLDNVTSQLSQCS